jgi:hypothetical protein
MWGLLGEFVDHGLVVQLTIGELIGRILSITVMDSTIAAPEEVCELKYQIPCLKREFFEPSIILRVAALVGSARFLYAVRPRNLIW